MSRVVVAMSGGVDSSAAAALLAKEGHEVIGMMLRLWSEPGCETENRCCSPEDMALARRVAAKLSIPFYAVDAQQPFYEQVVQPFIDDYLQGITPNPCLACNRHIRWEFLLNRALAMGADYLATGHYARLRRNEHGSIDLLRAVDSTKDQSYVLHVLEQEKLSHALFPLGEYKKSQVRQLAREFDLPAAERSDSQDLCFIGKDNYRDFIKRQAPESKQPGPILRRDGEQIGEHEGLAFYTIGQRKGLGIAAPQPLYVLEKDIQRNAIIVGQSDELGRQAFTAVNVNWVSGSVPEESFRALVKTRYTAKEKPAMVTPQSKSHVQVHLDQPLPDITPGQAAVFYDGDVCLGGGIIQLQPEEK